MVVCFVAWRALAAAMSLAEDDCWRDLPRDAARMVGSQSCNAVSCHSRIEYRLFVQHDPHASAARTLVGDEFQRILKRVSNRQDGGVDAKVYSQCANCHDPEGIAAAATAGGLQPGHSLASRGIGCEACHGPAKKWLSRHYQRGVSKSELWDAGMIDTKDRLVRGRVCAECHVGSAENDVNHDMIAAGHPPLRFELAAYHRELTVHDSVTGKQSHWDDARERMETIDFETKLWAAGQVASAEGALALLQGRAQRSASEVEVAPWPEFAEYNCFACHQRLRPDPKEANRLGLPVWRTWNHAGIKRLMGAMPNTDSPAERESPERGHDTQNSVLSTQYSVLSTKISQGFALNPLDVASVAAQARKELRSCPLPHLGSKRTLALLKSPFPRDSSWDGACQRFLGLMAVRKSISDEFRKKELRQVVVASEKTLFDRERARLDGQFAEIRYALSFPDKGAEWPRVMVVGGTAPANLDVVNAALGQLAQELEKLRDRWNSADQ